MRIVNSKTLYRSCIVDSSTVAKRTELRVGSAIVADDGGIGDEDGQVSAYGTLAGVSRCVVRAVRSADACVAAWIGIHVYN